MHELPTLTKEEQRRLLAERIRASRHVLLDDDRIEAVAERAQASFDSAWMNAYRRTDEHYGERLIELDDLDALQYAVIAASQVWLIWEREPLGKAVPLRMTVGGVRYVGSYTLGASHARAITTGRGILEASVLANYTMDDVHEHYRDEATGEVKVQLLAERLENFRELGQVLLDKYDGHFVNVLRRADRRLFRDDGSGFMQLLATDFPKCFGDWPYAKLPNVFTFMLLELRDQRRFAPEINELLDFQDLADLEGGADYYRPWFFLRVGVFDISEEFLARLRRHELIERGSDIEHDFRALTIEGMRRLAQSMKGDYVAALRLLERETHAQALLRCRRCRVGISDEELPCPYRPICKATHSDHRLMDCGFPLVLTREY